MSAPALPGPLRVAAADIDAALASFLDVALPRVAGHDPRLVGFTDELRRFVLGGGKRLRPLFVLLGHRAAGGDGAVLDAALAVELLHTCALIHDDVIDAAPTRRGRSSAHVAFEDDHRASARGGESRRFGEALAILLGDLAYVHADELLLRATPTARLGAAFAIFTTMREELVAGQALDVIAAAGDHDDADTARTVATLKSGRYSVTRPLQLGAVLAGGDDAFVTGLAAFGEPLGEAFQLRDDVLGVFGGTDVTGKPDASDLVEGKRTLLTALVSQRLSPDDRGRFDALLSRRAGLDDDGIDRLRALMVASGAVDAADERCRDLVAIATAALAALPIDAGTAGDLVALAGYVVERMA